MRLFNMTFKHYMQLKITLLNQLRRVTISLANSMIVFFLTVAALSSNAETVTLVIASRCWGDLVLGSQSLVNTDSTFMCTYNEVPNVFEEEVEDTNDLAFDLLFVLSVASVCEFGYEVANYFDHGDAQGVSLEEKSQDKLGWEDEKPNSLRQNLVAFEGD